jgi:hypothetical protein
MNGIVSERRRFSFNVFVSVWVALVDVCFRVLADGVASSVLASTAGARRALDIRHFFFFFSKISPKKFIFFTR